MRILILSINYWPEETGIGAFTTYRAEHLASAGHDVTVCTTFPYYPEWKVSREYAGRLLSTEERNGVRIVRSYAYVPNPVTSMKRVMHEASFIATSFARALGQTRPDVLFVVSPPLGLTLSAIVLSRMWRTPYVFEVEDLQPDAAADLGMLPPWALKVMYKVESAAYRNAALVSTLTEGMRAKIISKGIAAEKVELFEPRADETLFEIAPEEGAKFRKRHGLGAKFIVTHSGNMGMKQGLEVILDAADRSHDDESTIFLLVGDGAARNRIEARAREMQLENVRFMPVLDSMEYRGLLAASDVCLVTQLKTVSDIVFPSKTVSYLAAGCAVVGSVNAASEVARAIMESRAGLVVEPENAQKLSQAISTMRQQDLSCYKARAREYAGQRWAPARVLGHLERTLVSVANGSEWEMAARAER
ncbi:MAG TPA: WcaI family glycosyltransferase [candidate division Zixibacteria bacterium]|nr:WcaI family glycosyltransferase [candidate division Zixibacteria bacterium]